jgi:hypothetical protein
MPADFNHHAAKELEPLAIISTNRQPPLHCVSFRSEPAFRIGLICPSSRRGLFSGDWPRVFGPRNHNKRKTPLTSCCSVRGADAVRQTWSALVVTTRWIASGIENRRKTK